MKTKRAAESDGVPPETVKTMTKTRLELVPDMYNKILRDQTFPRIWKKATIILIWKGKPEKVASSYRPICPLNTFGKLLEKLLKARLEKGLENNGCLAPN